MISLGAAASICLIKYAVPCVGGLGLQGLVIIDSVDIRYRGSNKVFLPGANVTVHNHCARGHPFCEGQELHGLSVRQ